MRALALLLLLFGPVSSAPAAVGLWIWRQLEGRPHAAAYGLAAGAVAGVAVLALLRRRGLLREVTVLALSTFWAAWLWFALTDRGYDWTQAPALRVPSTLERMPLLSLVLVYLTLYALAEQRPPRRLS
jgi:hypothetical protein